MNTSPTMITTAGAGGILEFMTNNPATTENVLIDANHVTNAGTALQLSLGWV
jgi:hypothetical protein